MTRHASQRRAGAMVAAALLALAATACGTPPQPGFAGAGCYDHRNLLVPTVHTPGECAAATWTWRTQDWKPSTAASAPKP